MSWFYALAGQSLASMIYAMMVACFLPFIWVIVAKVLGGFGVKDNQNPRQFLANTQGVAARANAAQANSFESLPMFLAAVIVAMYCFVPQSVINGIAWFYVLLRIGFGLAYLSNAATIRSIFWAGSMACIFALFVVSIRIVW